MMYQTRLSFLGCLALVGTALSAGAQQVDSAAFVTLLGDDTLAVERFVWTPTGIEAETLLRSPATRVGKYMLEMDSQGQLVRYEGSLWSEKGLPLRTSAPAIAPPPAPSSQRLRCSRSST